MNNYYGKSFMKMGKCFGGNMKKLVTSISKKNISILPNLIQYCESNDISEFIILLFGEVYGKNSIVEKDGLNQLVNALPKETNIHIHLVREGLGYTLSAKDYNEIFNVTNYSIETTYSCKCGNYQLNFKSNNLEDSMWDDEYFGELQKQASSKTDLKISAVYKPTSDDYMSSWGKSAWKLSEDLNSTLLYLDDGDIVEFIEDNALKIYSVNEQLNRKLIKKLK